MQCNLQFWPTSICAASSLQPPASLLLNAAACVPPEAPALGSLWWKADRCSVEPPVPVVMVSPSCILYSV